MVFGVNSPVPPNMIAFVIYHFVLFTLICLPYQAAHLHKTCGNFNIFVELYCIEFFCVATSPKLIRADTYNVVISENC